MSIDIIQIECVSVLCPNRFSIFLLMNGSSLPMDEFELSISGAIAPRLEEMELVMLRSIPCPIDAKVRQNCAKNM